MADDVRPAYTETGVEQAGPPRRRPPDLPPEFAPLRPLGSGLSPGPPRRAPGEPPRLRLTAAASRRNAPDRALPADVSSAPTSALAEALLGTPVPAASASRRPARGAGAQVVLVVVMVFLMVGAAVLLRPTGPTVAAEEAAPTAPLARPPESELDPPVTLAPDSEYVETDVLDGEDLVVTHWISTTSPVRRVRLRPPSSPVLAGSEVVVEDLVVGADGVRLGAGAVAVDVPSDLPPATTVYVRYRLADALERNSSVDDRALAAVTSLAVGLEGRSLPRTQTFPGGRVMTVACLAQGARALPQPCGTYVEGAWQVRSAAGEVPVAVIAQVDLGVNR